MHFKVLSSQVELFNIQGLEIPWPFFSTHTEMANFIPAVPNVWFDKLCTRNENSVMCYGYLYIDSFLCIFGGRELVNWNLMLLPEIMMRMAKSAT